jgi:pimeloyl-ACP methyl ester carboxylesterase
MLNHISNNGTGPEVILVHGNSMDHRIWSHQLADPALADLHITAIDLPGHGASPPYPEGRAYSVNALADDVAAFVKDLQAPVLVGHSLGGHICLRVLQRAPNVRGALIFGTPPVRGAQDLPAAYLPNPALMKAFQAELSEDEATALAEAYTWKGCAQIPSLVRMMRSSDPRMRGDLGQQMATGQFDDEQAMLRNANVPVCVAQGADDPFLSTAYLENLAPELFWNGTVQLIPHAGHTPQLQQPARFAEVLLHFMQAL